MRRNGRPRVDPDDDTANITVALPAREYDRLYAEAQQQRVSVPEVVRQKIRATRAESADE
jgi:hypothetical protein